MIHMIFLSKLSHRIPITKHMFSSKTTVFQKKYIFCLLLVFSFQIGKVNFQLLCPELGLFPDEELFHEV